MNYKWIWIFVLPLLAISCNSDESKNELEGAWIAMSKASKDIFYRPPLVIHVQGDSMSLSENLGQRNYYTWTRSDSKITYKNDKEESYFNIVATDQNFYTIELPTGDTLLFEKLIDATYTDKGEIEALLKRQTFELDIPNFQLRFSPMLFTEKNQLYYVAMNIEVDSSTMTYDTTKTVEIATYKTQIFDNTTFVEFEDLPNVRILTGYIGENTAFNAKGYFYSDGEKHDFTLHTVGTMVDTAALVQQFLGKWKGDTNKIDLVLNPNRTFQQGELGGTWQLDETGELLTLLQDKPIVLGVFQNAQTLTCTNLSEFNTDYITFKKMK